MGQDIIKWLTFLFILIINNNNYSYADDIPEYILPCSRSDPQINNCIKGSFNHLRPYLIRGLPELDVQPIEPMRIKELVMENTGGSVRFTARFPNIITKGISNFTVVDVRSDVKKLRIDMKLTIPRLEVRGKYDVDGSLLLLNVVSNGDFWAEFTNVTAIIKIFGKQVTRENDIKYMDVPKLVMDFAVKNARFKVKDRKGENNVLGQAINQFLNTNAKELIHEMRPAASESIGKIIQDILNSAFSRVPMNVWLLD